MLTKSLLNSGSNLYLSLYVVYFEPLLFVLKIISNKQRCKRDLLYIEMLSQRPRNYSQGENYCDRYWWSFITSV